MTGWIAFGVILVLFLISVRYNFVFAKRIFKFNDATEDALRILDDVYNSVYDVLEMPVAADSEEIRFVVKRVDDAHSAILQVSNIMAHAANDTVSDDQDTGQNSPADA